MCHFDPLGKPISYYHKALKLGISRDCQYLTVILKSEVSIFYRFRVIKRQKRRFAEGFRIYIYIFDQKPIEIGWKGPTTRVSFTHKKSDMGTASAPP